MRTFSFSKFIVLFVTIWVSIIYLIVFPITTEYMNDDADITIWVISIIGWGLLFFCLLTWKHLTGNLFTIYSIFVVFAFLFTYGQCLMWALGIHLPGEIGASRLYTLGVPTKEGIIRTQLYSLVGLLVFHCGAILSYKKHDYRETATFLLPKDDLTDKYPRERDILFYVCKLTSIISTPLMFYSIIRNIAINRLYGYGAALYNAEVVASQNNIVLLLRMMYFPSIIGLLIGSKYRSQIVRVCYINFFIFTVLSIFAGDRGEWLFPLCFLLWMHHKYKSRLNIKKIFRFCIIGILLIIISVGVRNSRSSGVTVSGLLSAIAGESNPIVSAIFELGGSMRPTLIVMQYGWGKYPFGNTYILALFGMVTERLIMVFIPNYRSLSSWFSRSYLGISYGAGFSFLAEAIINYGPYVALIALFILGVAGSKIMFSVEKIDANDEPIKAFIGISTAYAMIQGIRNTLLVAAKTWVFSTLLIYLLYVVYRSYIMKRKKYLNPLSSDLK